MGNRYLLNKQILIGYVFLAISIIVSLVYIFTINFSLENNYDAFNYFWSYKYLLRNIFDFNGLDKLNYFGRSNEFIYPYLINIITLFGKLNINMFIFLTSSFTYAFLAFSYLNLNKIYNKSFTTSAIGLQLQMLSAILPLGLTIQVSRQSFAFAMLLFSLIILRRIKYISTLAPYFILFSTHLYSSVLILFEYLLRKKKMFLLMIYFLMICCLMNYLVTSLSYYNTLTLDDDFSSIDKYFLISIISLIIIRGRNLLNDFRFIFLIIIGIVYLLFSIGLPVFTRVFFGAGWFWIIVLGFQIIGNENIIKHQNRITLISLFLLCFKIFTLGQRFSIS